MNAGLKKIGEGLLIGAGGVIAGAAMRLGGLARVAAETTVDFALQDGAGLWWISETPAPKLLAGFVAAVGLAYGGADIWEGAHHLKDKKPALPATPSVPLAAPAPGWTQSSASSFPWMAAGSR